MLHIDIMTALRTLCLSIVDRIDSGSCSLSDADTEELLRIMSYYASPKMYSVAQSARYLRVTRQTIYNYVKSGTLPQPVKMTAGINQCGFSKAALDEAARRMKIKPDVTALAH